MTRKILFKGFAPNENGTEIAVVNGKEYKGDWVDGFYFNMHHNDKRLHIHHFIIPNNTPIPKERPIGEIQVEVFPETVGQFTGLTDKNGKMIFEGDYAIVKDSKGQMRLKCVYVNALCGYFWERSIYLNKQGWWFDSLDKFESHRNIEIIGNIHDKEV